jgi:hypothetical protein
MEMKKKQIYSIVLFMAILFASTFAGIPGTTPYSWNATIVVQQLIVGSDESQPDCYIIGTTNVPVLAKISKSQVALLLARKAANGNYGTISAWVTAQGSTTLNSVSYTMYNILHIID